MPHEGTALACGVSDMCMCSISQQMRPPAPVRGSTPGTYISALRSVLAWFVSRL